MDAVATQAGVARTTLYRRYRDKADLVSAAIDTLRQPASRADSGDARRDLVAHLDSARRNFDMSLAGTLLMEEPHDPRLIELFRERMVLPRRQIVRDMGLPPTCRSRGRLGRGGRRRGSRRCS